MNAVLKEDLTTAVRRIFSKQLNQGFTLKAIYPYTLMDGSVWNWRVRLDHRSGDKIVRPVKQVGSAFEIGEPATPKNGKPLYMPSLIGSPSDAPVFCVEGEKCVDALASIGVVAVTSGSCSSASAADWSLLRGRDVYLWRDNDEAGKKYRDGVRAKLRELGVVPKEIDLDALGVGDKGDCVDYLADHPEATAETILALPLVPATAPDGLQLVRADSIMPEPINWAWPGWIARGKMHVIAGAPGTGKTTLVMDFVASITSGRPLPDGYIPPQGEALIWSGEDSFADTLVPRLLAAGADMSKVHFIGDVTEGGETFSFDPANDVWRLVTAAEAITNLAVIVVDPLVSAVGGDSHKNSEVRRGLAPLVDFAAQRNAALLGITHYTKGTQGREPLERVSGSLAFGAVARVVLGTIKQKSDAGGSTSNMLLARAKSNIGPDGGGFAYTFEQVSLPQFNDLAASRICWGESVEGTPRELLTEADHDNDPGHQDALDFLRECLRTGPRSVKDVLKEGVLAGYTNDCLRRAKNRLGVRAKKTGMTGGWEWSLSAAEECRRAPEDGEECNENNVHSSHSSVPSSGTEVMSV